MPRAVTTVICPGGSSMDESINNQYQTYITTLPCFSPTPQSNQSLNKLPAQKHDQNSISDLLQAVYIVQPINQLTGNLYFGNGMARMLN